MASICNKPNGHRWIQFTDAARKRKTIRLGKMNKRNAEKVKSVIEELLSCKISQTPNLPDTAKWLADCEQSLHDKLVRAGLAEQRETVQETIEKPIITISELVRQYSAMKKNGKVKPATLIAYECARKKLLSHFGDIDIQSITFGSATEFNEYLKGDCAQATKAKYIKLAKQFFEWACDKQFVEFNPFSKLKAGKQTNEARQYYVKAEIIDKAMDYCPNDDWKAILALYRYGGLRPPSELARLRWDDINFPKKVMLVHSPKTEHFEGHESRLVPITPPLQKVLSEKQLNARVGSEFVIERQHLRQPTTNHRTQIRRILKLAGFEPWPRLLQNLRASCATDLVEVYPTKDVSKWLGHSEVISMKHYQTARHQHMEHAATHDPFHTSQKGDVKGDALFAKSDVKCDADSAVSC